MTPSRGGGWCWRKGEGRREKEVLPANEKEIEVMNGKRERELDVRCGFRRTRVVKEGVISDG